MNTRRFAVLLIASAIALASCSDQVLPGPTQPSEEEVLIPKPVPVRIAKWHNDLAGAITLTYNTGWPAVGTDNKVQMLATAYGCKVDLELITAHFRQYEALRSYLQNVIIPMKIGVFGNGDERLNHDSMSYEQAYASFRRCFDTMKDMGLEPVSYAYPQGMGLEQETWQALSDAGFLSGRGFRKGEVIDPFIMPGSLVEPPNWYNLPTLVAEEFSVSQCEACIASAQELAPYLDEAVARTAWIISTYHEIYDLDETGRYSIAEFENDLREIKKRDLWCATFNEATLYARERSKATAQANWYRNTDGVVRAVGVVIDDKLPDDRYHQQLTVVVDVPESWVDQPLGIFDGKTFISEFTTDSPQATFSLLPTGKEYRIVVLHSTYTTASATANGSYK